MNKKYLKDGREVEVIQKLIELRGINNNGTMDTHKR